jgi:hypothetical protein
MILIINCIILFTKFVLLGMYLFGHLDLNEETLLQLDIHFVNNVDIDSITLTFFPSLLITALIFLFH